VLVQPGEAVLEERGHDEVEVGQLAEGLLHSGLRGGEVLLQRLALGRLRPARRRRRVRLAQRDLGRVRVRVRVRVRARARARARFRGRVRVWVRV